MIQIKGDADWLRLSGSAWSSRERAVVFGKTKVGCALLSECSNLYAGCNIEHRFRVNDLHAEINAIGMMVSSGEMLFSRLLIVAERDLFTPCGSCTDWIMQFSNRDALVGFQSAPGGDFRVFHPEELMPFYPK